MDVAAQQIDIPFDDMQSETGALDVECVAATEKTGEKVLLIFSGDADSLVLYCNGEAAAREMGRPQPDVCTFG